MNTSYITKAVSKEDRKKGEWCILVRNLPRLNIVQKITGFDSPYVAITAAFIVGYPVRVSAKHISFFKNKYKTEVTVKDIFNRAPRTYKVTV